MELIYFYDFKKKVIHQCYSQHNSIQSFLIILMDMTEKLWGENFLIPSGEIYSFYLYKHNLVSTFIIGGGGGICL